MPEERATQPQLTTTRRGLTPLRAFAVVATLALLTGTALYFSTPDIAQSPQSDAPPAVLSPSPARASPLSRTEATQLFEELRADALSVGLKRDETAIGNSMVEDGPLAIRSASLIRRLRQSDVIDRTRFRLLKVRMLNAEPDRMRFQTVHEVRPCFVTEEGQDVTKAPAVVQQSVIWTLFQVEGRWLINDTALKEEKVVEDKRAQCA